MFTITHTLSQNHSLTTDARATPPSLPEHPSANTACTHSTTHTQKDAKSRKTQLKTANTIFTKIRVIAANWATNQISKETNVRRPEVRLHRMRLCPWLHLRDVWQMRQHWLQRIQKKGNQALQNWSCLLWISCKRWGLLILYGVWWRIFFKRWLWKIK